MPGATGRAKAKRSEASGKVPDSGSCDYQHLVESLQQAVVTSSQMKRSTDLDNASLSASTSSRRSEQLRRNEEGSRRPLVIKRVEACCQGRELKPGMLSPLCVTPVRMPGIAAAWPAWQRGQQACHQRRVFGTKSRWKRPQKSARRSANTAVQRAEHSNRPDSPALWPWLQNKAPGQMQAYCTGPQCEGASVDH